MMDYNFDYEIYKLSSKFETDYPISKYPEILYKSDRPHYCLLIETHCDYFICVPFRSNIDHNNAFLFKGTKRSKKSHSGLDYSKMIIIKDTDYLDNTNVVIDQDEYNQAIKYIDTIVNESVSYLETYVNHIKGIKPLHQRKFDRLYKFSSLKYFHNILGITDAQSDTEKKLLLI